MWFIASRLYLGNYRSGCAALEGERVPVLPSKALAPFTGVVSLCPVPLYPTDEAPAPAFRETEWLCHPIADGGNGEDEFERTLGLALPFIRARREKGNVLVHCAAGMSRSVSVIAALLCEEEGTSVDAAYARIADRKAAAVQVHGVPPQLLIAPAWEFQSCLSRLYPVESAASPA